MPRSLTNAYWIHVGELRERERIIALLKSQAYPGCNGDEDQFCFSCNVNLHDVIDIVKGVDRLA